MIICSPQTKGLRLVEAKPNVENMTKICFIQSRLSRQSTARGSSTGLVPAGPTKVKARKSDNVMIGFEK